MTATVLRGNALALPLDDDSVDLVVTSPPYFGLRSYQDGCNDCDSTGKAKRPDSHGMKVCPNCGNVANRKRCNRCDASMKWPSRAATFGDESCPTCNGTGKGHYAGQLGSEPTPGEFVDALIAATREMMRVVKPSGSIWVNLGDKYAGGGGQWDKDERATSLGKGRSISTGGKTYGLRAKSLIGIPWRYALRCIDDLGLILRAEVIWSKPNGLPESVTDRVRRSHEQWFHFTLNPRYYSAVDEIREEHAALDHFKKYGHGPKSTKVDPSRMDADRQDTQWLGEPNPLGKLPGSVWTIPTQPLTVPTHLGVDHFAAFPMELPRRIVTGWSPRGVCSACGEGRRPVAERGDAIERRGDPNYFGNGTGMQERWGEAVSTLGQVRLTAVTGYTCACPDTHAPTTPGVVLDPFGGTGTTALVAHALGRHGISVDMSADYCRLAAWRTQDEGELARALQVDKPARQIDGQASLLDLIGEGA
jgi:DNA modification methylase